MHDPCIAHYTNVCVTSQANRSDQFDLRYDPRRSTCDGAACESNHSLRFQFNGTRLPISSHEPLPARHRHTFLPATAMIPSLPFGEGMADNMAHIMYDSVALEAEICLRTNVTHVLGRSLHTDHPYNVVHELRRRLLSRAQWLGFGAIDACFAHVWTYSFSCDRSLKAYGTASFDARIKLLRSLAVYVTTPRPTAVFYARSDTARRRLLQADSHIAAVRQRLYKSEEYDVINWDELWGTGTGTGKGADRTALRPSVEEQIQRMRNAARIITPHGAFPSVWGLFLRPDAIIYELTAACYYYTWLPAGLLRRPPYKVRHVYLSWRISDIAKAVGYNHSLQLIWPRTGRVTDWTSPWCCCKHVPRDEDLDLRVPPAHLCAAAAQFEPLDAMGKQRRHGGRGRGFKGSEY
mmetsp:Transcript_81084/g.161195  ORF Transcript_81084/g.161195 Transcript_81084/m.161195 type:complete len:406 (-) Transcript_81084:78-1295(-)